MERLLKQWQQKLNTYQNGINASMREKDISFWKGKKAALEVCIEELQNFISFNNHVSGELCQCSDRATKHFVENWCDDCKKHIV